MLTELFREKEDLIEPDGLVQVKDWVVDEGRVRRVTLYWYAQVPGFYGPNGFTADWRLGRPYWLVRAVSGIAAVKLMPGAPISEGGLVEVAREIFETALKEQEHDPDYRRKAGHEVGSWL